MGSGAGPSTREPYRRACDRMRRELEPTLDALDRAAGDPSGLEELADELPSLQYALHTASERVHELDLGLKRQAACALEVALAAAREETADVAATFEEAGPAAAATLVWEWRVALFAVRLALLELDAPRSPPAPAPRPQAASLGLLLIGVATVLGGALASLWLVWALGLLLVAVSTALSHRLAQRLP